MLFPIPLVPFEGIKTWKLFDADRGIDSAREIREYFVPDFSKIVIEMPQKMTSEDFAEYGAAGVPSVLLHVGAVDAASCVNDST